MKSMAGAQTDVILLLHSELKVMRKQIIMKRELMKLGKFFSHCSTQQHYTVTTSQQSHTQKTEFTMHAPNILISDTIISVSVLCRYQTLILSHRKHGHQYADEGSSKGQGKALHTQARSWSCHLRRSVGS
jgi:hypothetical protein